MKLKNINFIKSAFSSDDFPDYNLPEVAFTGRSNTGKSSLINMICGQKNLVKTGSRPGVTTAVNFFVADNRISIADLPGYGYARLPDEIKKKFIPLIKSYLSSRNNLKLVFILMDIRRTPGDEERKFIELLTNNRIPVAVTLTKSDKLSNNGITKSLALAEKKLQINRKNFFVTSAHEGRGKKEILQAIEQFIKIKAESSDT